jgi:5'-nucleotidase
LVISAHTHQGYTCKIDGHLLVQGRSYGAYLTETTLTIDRNSKQVVNAVATNHLVDQTTIKADPMAQRLLEQVTSLTVAVRSRPITVLAAPLTRASKVGHFDNSLGNVIADAQLQFAKNTGDGDISFMNAGGIRNDLPSGNQSSPVAINFGDIYAVQPFGNNLVKMRLSGQQIITLLQQQWQDRSIDDPKKLFVSQGFSYAWKPSAEMTQRVQDVRLNGQLLDPTRQYSVIVNSFLADGGDGFTVLKQGTNRQIVGRDLDAFEAHIRQQGGALSDVKTDRVRRFD